MPSILWSKIGNRVALGIAGLSFGVATFVLAGYELVQLLSGPDYLISLYWAIYHVRVHQQKDADLYVFAQLAGSVIAVAGTGALALLLTFLGVPPRMKDVPAVSGETKPLPPS